MRSLPSARSAIFITIVKNNGQNHALVDERGKRKKKRITKDYNKILLFSIERTVIKNLLVRVSCY